MTNVITFLILQLFRSEQGLKSALQILMPVSLAEIISYLIQHLIAWSNLPLKLYSSQLMDRAGMTNSMGTHAGILNTLDFIYYQHL